MLVAVQASTGEILAVASTKEYNQEKDALAGKFPAGTAFSIMSVEGLIKAEMNPKQKLACPGERTVGGARFRPGGTARRRDADLQANFATGLRDRARLARPQDRKRGSETSAPSSASARRGPCR